MLHRVAGVSVSGTVFRLLTNTSLRPAALRCLKSIFYNFFFCQYRAALFPGKIPVSRVDHELDKKIPFIPDWINIYNDFTAFWIRSIGFLLREHRALGEEITAEGAVGDFLDSIKTLYSFAGGMYQKNLSTTARPFYIRRPGFLMIHIFDPHLMCIPSLHVMVVIRAYTGFTAILRSLGKEKTYAPQIAELKRGALDIIESILYVKQHSVNCVAAAMYAMTCLDPALFPPSEAVDFISRLFAGKAPGEPSSAAEKLPHIGGAGDMHCTEIRKYIENLYRRFLSDKSEAGSWDTPLINFLQSLPKKGTEKKFTQQSNRKGSYGG